MAPKSSDIKCIISSPIVLDLAIFSSSSSSLLHNFNLNHTAMQFFAILGLCALTVSAATPSAKSMSPRPRAISCLTSISLSVGPAPGQARQEGGLPPCGILQVLPLRVCLLPPRNRRTYTDRTGHATSRLSQGCHLASSRHHATVSLKLPVFPFQSVCPRRSLPRASSVILVSSSRSRRTTAMSSLSANSSTLVAALSRQSLG